MKKSRSGAFVCFSVVSSFYCRLLCDFKRNSAIYESLFPIVCGLHSQYSWCFWRRVRVDQGIEQALHGCCFLCLYFVLLLKLKQPNRTNVQSPFISHRMVKATNIVFSNKQGGFMTQQNFVDFDSNSKQLGIIILYGKLKSHLYPNRLIASIFQQSLC